MLEIIASISFLAVISFILGFFIGVGRGERKAKKAFLQADSVGYDVLNPINRVGVDCVEDVQTDETGKTFYRMKPISDWSGLYADGQRDS